MLFHTFTHDGVTAGWLHGPENAIRLAQKNPPHGKTFVTNYDKTGELTNISFIAVSDSPVGQEFLSALQAETDKARDGTPTRIVRKPL